MKPPLRRTLISLAGILAVGAGWFWISDSREAPQRGSAASSRAGSTVPSPNRPLAVGPVNAQNAIGADPQDQSRVSAGAIAVSSPATAPPSDPNGQRAGSGSGPASVQEKEPPQKSAASRTPADVLSQNLDLRDPLKRAEVVRQLKEIEDARKKEAWERAAKMGIPTQGMTPGGGRFELQYFEDGKPVYHASGNANAAISTAAHQVRGVGPFNVTGANITVGIWEAGGIPRVAHQEFVGRIAVKDGATVVTDHATHVTGTIGAAGVNSVVRGMAPGARLDAYDSSSAISEMTSAGASAPAQTGRLFISNHSYGPLAGWDGTTWYGRFTDNGNAADDIEDDFGRYSSTSRDHDSLCFALPYYLPVFSAGNHRNDVPPSNGSNWTEFITGTVRVYNSSQHPAGDGVYKGGYDIIGAQGVAKNLLTVGAVSDAVTSGTRSVAAATLTAFSSTGPTDDGRIKPDIVANGDGVTSTGSSSDTASFTTSGTSMSAPNITGSAALLIDYYGTRFPGQAMRASTLKSLIIHTADDLGNPGPDYRYGWGLMNTKAAADLIKRFADGVGSASDQAIVEGSLSTTNTSRTYTYRWNGVDPIRVTLGWTDPAGAATTAHDDRTRKLVNDLNVAVTGPTGTAYQPYIMPYVGDWTAAKFTANATTGINTVDNLEQVFIAAPGAQGIYTVTVSHAGTLTNGAQNFSLIVSGQVATPANDNFADRALLTGVPTSVTASNANATNETGEPVHARSTGGHSVWWTWTAPQSGRLDVNTVGSSFDTLLAVYTGTTLPNLVPIGWDDEAGGNNTSSLSMFVTAGVTYAIAVDGYQGASGLVNLNLTLTQSNDLYATDFEAFTLGANQLGGSRGWLTSNNSSGVTGIVTYNPTGQAGYIGFNPPPAGTDSALAWRPLGYNPVAAGTPVLQFSVEMAILDSTTGPRDSFSFMVYNTEGEVLGGVVFNNTNQRVLRYDTATSHDVGAFARNTRYTLLATIDFATNRWSATLGGATLFTNQPLNATTPGPALTLGDIDAFWAITVGGSPGNNYLLFDNYRISLLPPGNTPPTISDIANLVINEDEPSGPLAFTVGDAQTPAGNLTTTGSSSNPTLIPNSGVFVLGNSANRTVSIQPAPNQSGTATITITVSDGSLAASDTFIVTVNAVNDPPTISDVTNRTVNEDTSTGAIAFTVGDVETTAGNLTLSVTSSNLGLFPLSNIALGGSGANRTVTLTPALNQSGNSTIRITVSDGARTSSNLFVVEVSAVNDAPTISDIANQSIAIGTSAGALAFLVDDAEVRASGLLVGLTVTGSSSNPALVPNTNIVFGGGYFDRTITVTPVAGQIGSATITVTVSDGGLTATDTFTVVVNAVVPMASHAVPGASYLAGGTVTVNNTAGFPGVASQLKWEVLLPAGWTLAADGSSGASTRPSVGQGDVLTWIWTTQSSSPVNFAYSLHVPADQTGDKQLAAIVTVTQGGSPTQVLAQPDPLVLRQQGIHSADSNRDFEISLLELTRVIELYNTRNGTVRTGAYRVDATNPEDGFAPDSARPGGSTAVLARYHSADTRGATTGSPRDGAIDLFELTRVIELYNTRAGTVRTGRYHVAGGTEDGFAAGP